LEKIDGNGINSLIQDAKIEPLKNSKTYQNILKKLILKGDKMRGVIIILTKGYNSKSRLSLNKKNHRELIDALTTDLYKTAAERNKYKKNWDCFIATSDPIFSKKFQKKNIPIIDLQPGELNYIFYQIQNWSIKEGYNAIILCAGDIPLLHRILINSIKRKIHSGLRNNGKSMVICPSKDNGVSIIAMSPVDLWMIKTKEGVDNLEVIKSLDAKKYPYQIINDFKSYLDLDHQEDLYSALDYMDKNPIYGNRLVKKILDNVLSVKTE
jgi:2-phospho-L-lactate guanylyltransferase (CobY/MobA/RfbA family)